MKVVYVGPQLPSYLARHRARLPEGWTYASAVGNDAGLAAMLADADFILALAPVTAEMIEGAPRLRFIQALATGYDHIDVRVAARRGIGVATAGDSNTASVAEHALTLILCVLRRVLPADAGVRDGRWLQLSYYGEGRVRALAGATAGLIGFGRIGQHLGRLLSAFGARVVYTRRTRPPAVDDRALGASHLPLAELLRAADIVSIHVPLTPETRHLVGREQLALMKPSAVLVNVSRGDVVDEAALVEALSDGRLGGAGLDVFHSEPLPAGHPLTRLPNVVLTPHIGGAAVEAIDRTCDIAFDNLWRVAAGRPPESAVVLAGTV